MYNRGYLIAISLSDMKMNIEEIAMSSSNPTRSTAVPASTTPKSRFHVWFGDLKITDGYTDFVQWGRGIAVVTELYDQFGRVVYAPEFVRRLIRNESDETILAAAAAALESAGPRVAEKRIPEDVDFHASRERAFPLLDELVQRTPRASGYLSNATRLLTGIKSRSRDIGLRWINCIRQFAACTRRNTGR